MRRSTRWARAVKLPAARKPTPIGRSSAALYDTTAPENANDVALKKWKGQKEGRWLAAISGSTDPVLIAVADDHETLLAEIKRLHSTDDVATKEAADEAKDKP